MINKVGFSQNTMQNRQNTSNNNIVSRKKQYSPSFRSLFVVGNTDVLNHLFVDFKSTPLLSSIFDIFKTDTKNIFEINAKTLKDLWTNYHQLVTNKKPIAIFERGIIKETILENRWLRQKYPQLQVVNNHGLTNQTIQNLKAERAVQNYMNSVDKKTSELFPANTYVFDIKARIT